MVATTFMVINWPEIALIVLFNASVLTGFGLVIAKVWLPRKEQELLSKGEIWMGGAIGRFMQRLTDQAVEEEGAASSPGASGALNLGGFKIDAATIQSIAQILQVVQQMGFLKGVGGGGGSNPFLKP